jgi:hypothetical protein
MPSTATGWLNARFGGGPVATAFTTQQTNLQNHFAGQLATIGNAVTRRVMKKGIWRVGKLLWAASLPVHGNATRFTMWTKTKRSTSSEQNLVMNCWEGVLYLAYQCDAISKQKCVTFYQLPTANDLKLRALFGTAAVLNVGGGAIPNMGDILTFEDTNNGGAVVNHIALYAGVFGGTHYVLHNLSYHAHTTGLQMGGGFHFEDLASLNIRYNNNLTIYYTRPFWEAGAPTHRYYSLL